MTSANGPSSSTSPGIISHSSAYIACAIISTSDWVLGTSSSGAPWNALAMPSSSVSIGAASEGVAAAKCTPGPTPTLRVNGSFPPFFLAFSR